jgi:DNA-binding NarL/FixJ family response regulator
MIRVLLIDDEERFRQTLARLLQMFSDIEVVGQAGSLAQARSLLEGVEVALIDRVLPDGDGLELIGELREVSPDAKVLAMSATVEAAHPLQALEAGADGILDKMSTPEQMLAQIREVVCGKRR